MLMTARQGSTDRGPDLGAQGKLRWCTVVGAVLGLIEPRCTGHCLKLGTRGANRQGAEAAFIASRVLQFNP